MIGSRCCVGTDPSRAGMWRYSPPIAVPHDASMFREVGELPISASPAAFAGTARSSTQCVAVACVAGRRSRRPCVAVAPSPPARRSICASLIGCVRVFVSHSGGRAAAAADAVMCTLESTKQPPAMPRVPSADAVIWNTTLRREVDDLHTLHLLHASEAAALAGHLHAQRQAHAHASATSAGVAPAATTGGRRGV